MTRANTVETYPTSEEWLLGARTAQTLKCIAKNTAPEKQPAGTMQHGHLPETPVSPPDLVPSQKQDPSMFITKGVLVAVEDIMEHRFFKCGRNLKTAIECSFEVRTPLVLLKRGIYFK
ncbi:hypothetical protein QQ045_020962 [Rhodiola kirilowii]